MTTLIPNSQSSGVEAYEDMFKEITRKLYGEDASHNLHTPAHITSGATDVERSFTNLVSFCFKKTSTVISFPISELIEL